MAIKHVPEIYRTVSLYVKAISQCGEALQYLPIKYKSYSLCKIAVEQDGMAVKYILSYDSLDLKLDGDWENISNLYVQAVTQDGMSLSCIPEKYRTIKLCSIAVNQNCASLTFVPLKFRTLALCTTAITQDVTTRINAVKLDPTKDNSFRYYDNKRQKLLAKISSPLPAVPIHLLTEDFCMLAIKQFPQSLRSVPIKLRTKKICLAAFQKDLGGSDSLLQFVPKEFRDIDMCLTALKYSEKAIHSVPKIFRTTYIMMWARVYSVYKNQIKEFLG